MNVLITNTVVLNGGDAAILLAIIRQVRRAFGESTEITVADTQPELARAYYPDLRFVPSLYYHALPVRAEGRFSKVRGAVRYLRWYAALPRLYAAAFVLGRGAARMARRLTTTGEWTSLSAYERADVVISSGGTYLVENYWLAPRIFDFRVALILGKPLVLYTQSMGPFGGPHVRNALRGVFRNAALILLRDDESLGYLNDLCDPSEVDVRQAADAVFALADAERIAIAATAPIRKGARLRVAISVREWPFFKTVRPEEGMWAYVDAVAALTEYLVRSRQASVVFLSTCQGVAGYAYDDSRVADDVVSRLPPDIRSNVRVDRAFHAPDELLRLLASFDLVVATRMHMAILALAAGTPVLPIAYEFKTDALFARLGMRDFVHDIEDVNAACLCRSADRMLADLSSIRQRLFPRVEAERRRADAAEEYLEAALRGRMATIEQF